MAHNWRGNSILLVPSWTLVFIFWVQGHHRDNHCGTCNGSLRFIDPYCEEGPSKFHMSERAELTTGEDSFKEFPTHFYRCGCISFSCISLSSSECLGARCSGRTCFCIEGNGFCLKPIKHSKSCVVCVSGNFEIINPHSYCSLYQQILCCECFWTSECTENGFTDPPVKPTYVAEKIVPEDLDGAYVLLGGCCSLASIYYNPRSMFGTYHRQNMFCFENEFVAARCLSYQPELQYEKPNTLCILFQGHSSFVHSFSLYIKAVSQCLCLDIRFILPFADREVPSVCTWVPMCTVCAAGRPYVALFKTIQEFATLAYPETPYHPNRAYENACAMGSDGGMPTGNDTSISYADVVLEDSDLAKPSDATVVYAEPITVKI